MTGRCRSRAPKLAGGVMCDDVQGTVSALRTRSVQCGLLLFVQHRAEI
jgi:hypothetical protein